VEIARRYTKIYFGENQISPGLISLSPLPTVHPGNFQLTTVRASTGFYPSFTLTMGRSPGFGSTSCNSTPYLDSVSLRLHLNRLNLAARRNSRTHYAKGTQSPFAPEGAIGLPPFVSKRFQVLFHSPHRGSFRLSLTVLVHYRSAGST
jgi:hypothetical protein